MKSQLIIIIINTQTYNVLVWLIIMRVYLRTYVVIGSNNNCDQVETYIGVMYKYKLTMYTLIYIRILKLIAWFLYQLGILIVYVYTL